MLVLVILFVAGLSDVSLAVATAFEGFYAASDSFTPDVQTAAVIDTVNVSSLSDSSLAEIGAELLKAPSIDDAASNLASVVGVSSNAKVMPALPAAILMVLTGFLCISLVRDRKTWLAACVGIICLCQLSISALPKLAGNLRSALKPTEVSSVISNYFALNETSFNTRSTTDTVCDFVISTQQNLTYKVSTFAANITSLYNFDSLFACRLRSAGQISVFSPALILSNLPHGPPV